MPHILHVIEYLDEGSASRTLLATASYSAKFGPYTHSIVSLKPAHPVGLEIAAQADIEVKQSPSITHLDSLVDDADIIQVEYWNSPAINKLLHTSLPPHRLVIYFHINGFSAPQVIHEDLYNMADLAIAASTLTFEEHPLFNGNEGETIPGSNQLITATTDFANVRNVVTRDHSGFNIGYIGTVDYDRLHRDFIPMSANIEIPNSTFIVCGEGITDIFQQQVTELHAEHRFDLKGHVKDINPVLEILDVYGYPISESSPFAGELMLQEVMYAGIPTVAFPYGGVKGLIQHNRTGLIVTSKEDYKLAIEYLHYNPIERKRLGINAAAYARAHFGAKNAARSFNKAYEHLLQHPKQYHRWGKASVPYSPHLSQEPPQTKDSSDLFVASLGPEGEGFSSSKYASDVETRIRAEERIGASAYSVYRNGLFRYQLDAPEDPFINLWTGLLLENQGDLSEAISMYTHAMTSDQMDWRVQWYIGRTLKKQGKDDEARKVYTSLRSSISDFDAITNDNSFTSSESSVISFSTATTSGVTEQTKENEDKKIRVSAIVSTYNAESFIDGCLFDLINQTLFKKDELEIIVIDACSQENEKEVVEGYQAYYDNISYLRTGTRETLYASWNRAISMAQGRYITSANTDDRHRHDALEILADYLDTHLNVALTYPAQIDTSIPNETFETTKSKKVLDWPPFSYQELERHCIIGSQPMWRRSLHDHYGMFRDSFRSAGDYEFWLRIGKQETFYKFPEVLGLYYRNPQGIEHGTNVSHHETIQIWKEYGIFERGIPVILNGHLLRSPEDYDKIFQQPVSTQPGQPAQSAKIKIRDPKRSFDAYITEFEEQLVLQNFPRALEVAEAAATLYPDLPYAYILKAIAFRQQENYPSALLTLEKSIQLEETPEALIELIQLSLATNNLEEAHKTRTYVLQRYPEWESRLGQIHIPALADQAQRDKEALSQPARLEDLNYTLKSFDDLKQEFEQYIKTSDVQQAEVLALSATRKFPDNYEAWILQATSYRLRGLFREAKYAIQQSLLLKENPEALIELLELSLSLGDKEEAIQIANAIRDSYPEYADNIKHLVQEQRPPFTASQTTLRLDPSIRNFMPLNPQRLSLLEPSDSFLVSFPGSGSSWLCNLLADVFQQSKGFTTSVDKLSIPGRQIIPDAHTGNLNTSWLKEHGFGRRVLRTFDIAGVSEYKLVYVFRNPIDALISAFHYYREDPLLRELATGSCDAFCIANIDNYNQHVHAALAIRDMYPDRILLLDFDYLIQQTNDALRAILSHLGIALPPQIMNSGIENRDFNQYLKHRKEIPLEFSTSDFLQSGNELTRLTIEKIIAALMPVYQDANRAKVSPQADIQNTLGTTLQTMKHFV